MLPNILKIEHKCTFILHLFCNIIKSQKHAKTNNFFCPLNFKAFLKKLAQLFTFAKTFFCFQVDQFLQLLKESILSKLLFNQTKNSGRLLQASPDLKQTLNQRQWKRLFRSQNFGRFLDVSISFTFVSFFRSQTFPETKISSF